MDGSGAPFLPPGEVRRDCEPHRGPFLKALGELSMLLGLLSCCLLLPSLIGFPVGLWTWRAARQDQEKMHAGLMDPDGREAAEVARVWANNGLVLCILAWCLWGCLLSNNWPDLGQMFEFPDR
jgi:hypothetical protein